MKLGKESMEWKEFIKQLENIPDGTRFKVDRRVVHTPTDVFKEGADLSNTVLQYERWMFINEADPKAQCLVFVNPIVLGEDITVKTGS